MKDWVARPEPLTPRSLASEVGAGFDFPWLILYAFQALVAAFVVELAARGTLAPQFALNEVLEDPRVGSYCVRSPLGFTIEINAHSKLRHPVHHSHAVSFQKLIRIEVRREVRRRPRLHAMLDDRGEKHRLVAVADVIQLLGADVINKKRHIYEGVERRSDVRKTPGLRDLEVDRRLDPRRLEEERLSDAYVALEHESASLEVGADKSERLGVEAVAVLGHLHREAFHVLVADLWPGRGCSRFIEHVEKVLAEFHDDVSFTCVLYRFAF